jgi:hypothetical protein
MKPTVYFIQAQSGGPIKIGLTTKAIEKRLAGLQTSHHQKLICLATTQMHAEADLHQKFKSLRLHGEWFKPSVTLLSWIQNNAKVTDDGHKQLAKPGTWSEG